MTDLDLPAAHRYFAVNCYNTTWDLLTKSERTPEEDEHMISLTFASYYHWTQRADFTPQNHSIALWQISRVYAVINQAENAIHFGNRCLEVSGDPNIAPFFRAYAHEALARSYKLKGDLEQASAHLSAARVLAEQVSELEDRNLLLADLETI